MGRYVPREWMLVDAYTAANRGDYSEIKALHNLFKKPYDEQPEMEVCALRSLDQVDTRCVSGVLFGWGQGKYYVKAPKEAANVGGVGFMS